jgi:hypothetical protein
MILKKRTTLPLALAASVALALPAAAVAGGDAPPLSPSVVGIPIERTQVALDNAANAIDEGKGATAAGPLRASRRYLIRSYKGAKYLIANQPAPPAEDARVSKRKFVRMARRFIRISRHRGASASRHWMRAQASDGPAGPVFADAATAVFSVFTSQYSAATASVGMLPDVKGNLLNRVQTSLNTAIVLRNRLVKIVATAAPPAPPEDAKAKASQEEGEVTTFDIVMPGLVVLLDDEMQQMRATSQDTSVPVASKNVLTNALAADQQIETRVNTLWPPAVDD